MSNTSGVDRIEPDGVFHGPDEDSGSEADFGEDEESDVGAGHQDSVRPLLTSLRLANFKCYGMPAPNRSFDVPLAALTLLYGDNSAGKSTLLQALLTIAQTLDWVPGPDDTWPRVVLNGTHLRLGTFRDVVHRHEFSDRLMMLGVSWRNRDGSDSAISFQFEYRENRGLLNKIDLELAGGKVSACRHSDMDGERWVGPVLVGDEDVASFLIGAVEGEKLATSLPNLPDAEIQWPSGPVQPVVSLAGTWMGSVVAWMSPDGRISEAHPTVAAASANFFGGIRRSLGEAFGGIRHLGPDRVLPRGHPVRDGDEVAGAGSDGRHLVPLLASNRDALVGKLNEVLENPLGLPYKLEILRYRRLALDSDTGQTGEDLDSEISDLGWGQDFLDVVLVRGGIPVAIGSGGYGFNHLLSILAEALREKSWPLLIEQPETHINPRLQANMAEFLLNSARGPEGGSQMIIETHSENILLRLQALVAGHPALADDISVVSVIPAITGDSALPRHEGWSSDGDLHPGPGDVFPEARLRAVDVTRGFYAG
ncbi:AAA family ATPase [Frankia canadensis]|nr:AAA family ATPase [Frankia canadensis]